MGKNKDFSSECIAQIIALKKSGIKTKEVAQQIGICERSVRRWVAKFNEQGGNNLPTHKKRPGKAKITGIRSKTIVKRAVQSTPRITARKLKENNPELFGPCLFDE